MWGALLLCVGAGAGQGSTQGGAVLVGRVVDVGGAPVPFAAVGLGCQMEIAIGMDSMDLLDQGRADGAGGFRLELPAEWMRRVGYRAPTLFAHAPGHGLAVVRYELDEIPIGYEFELRLPADAASRVRIVDAEGRPVEGARVLPLSCVDPGGYDRRVPESWWDESAPRSDAQGWAVLPVALDEVQRLGVQAHGHVSHVFAVHFQQPLPLPEELMLLPHASFQVRWVGDEPPAAALRLLTIERLSEGRTYDLECAWQVPLTADGPSEFIGPLGRKSSMLIGDDASVLRWLTLGGSDEIEISRGPTYPVHGKVVCAQSGAPVPGVRLQVSSNMSRGWVESGADGVYRFEACGAGGALHFALAPAGHRSTSSPQGGFRRPAGGESAEIPDLALEPTAALEGVVRDATGAPAAGAWIHALAELPSQGFVQYEILTALSDGEGRFALQDAVVGRTYALQATLAGFRAATSARAGQDLELELAPLLAVHGRLADQHGAPVAGARIEVWREPAPRRSQGKLQVLGGEARFYSGADGRFRTPAGLEPGVRYALRISGAGLEASQVEWTAAEKLAEGIELALSRREVLGGVLRGPDGTPLADVPVRLRRGGTSARTDEQGRFELDELPLEGDVLIAEPRGEPPHARWVNSGERTDWTLSSRAEAWAAEPAPPADRGLELRLAAELLETRYQEALASGNVDQLLAAAQRLARADPALVLERLAAGVLGTGYRRDWALASVAESLRAASPEEALAVAGSMSRSMSRALSVLASARLLDPPAERERLALLRADVRAVTPPEQRLAVLASLADRLLDLGEESAARGVLEEGRALAAHLPARDWPGYARCRLGEALMRVDPAAGRALIDELESKEDRGRHLGNSAHRLAASDPQAAESLMQDLPGQQFEAQLYASRVAYTMAPVDLERARAIAERHDRTGFAHGMIALALFNAAASLGAEEGTHAARVSLEAAFAAAEDTGRPPHWRYGPTTVAAALLPVAARVDPRGLAAWAARALAIPRPSGDLGELEAAGPWQADATLALYLAPWEPELARALLEPALEVYSRRDNTRASPGDLIPWAAACALDPEWAARLAREQGGRVADAVGLLLAIPPEERLRYVQDRYLGLWIVGKEDL